MISPKPIDFPKDPSLNTMVRVSSILLKPHIGAIILIILEAEIGRIAV
jgi:hypothetical protein